MRYIKLFEGLFDGSYTKIGSLHSGERVNFGQLECSELTPYEYDKIINMGFKVERYQKTFYTKVVSGKVISGEIDMAIILAKGVDDWFYVNYQLSLIHI